MLPATTLVHETRPQPRIRDDTRKQRLRTRRCSFALVAGGSLAFSLRARGRSVRAPSLHPSAKKLTDEITKITTTTDHVTLDITATVKLSHLKLDVGRGYLSPSFLLSSTTTTVVVTDDDDDDADEKVVVAFLFNIVVM